MCVEGGVSNVFRWSFFSLKVIYLQEKQTRDCSALKRSIRDLASRISNMQTNNELIKHYYNEKKRYKTLIRKKQTR